MLYVHSDLAWRVQISEEGIDDVLLELDQLSSQAFKSQKPLKSLQEILPVLATIANQTWASDVEVAADLDRADEPNGVHFWTDGPDSDTNVYTFLDETATNDSQAKERPQMPEEESHSLYSGLQMPHLRDQISRTPDAMTSLLMHLVGKSVGGTLNQFCFQLNVFDRRLAAANAYLHFDDEGSVGASDDDANSEGIDLPAETEIPDYE